MMQRARCGRRWVRRPGNGCCKSAAQPARRHAAHTDLAGPDELGKRSERLADAGQRGFDVEPRLEVNVTDLEEALRPVRLGIDAADQRAVVEDRHRVVAVDAVGLRCVDLDAVAEAEETRDPLATPAQLI
jgi:hypothetical protein